MKNIDEKYMNLCIDLALKGKGHVEPNPLVGCIIVKNNKVIGKGYHKIFGANHAEVNAVNDALKTTKKLKGSTLYVNLEPCSHFGKTPPCSDLIINHKFKRVVIGLKDPNPLVNGKGIARLKKAGIIVNSGILTNKCIELNEKFIVNVTQNRPYITIKIAQSIDGKIALNNFSSKWITDIFSREFAHELRAQNDCILIGKNSVIQDNPELTVRLVKSLKHPVRIVIDKDLKLTSKYKLLKNKPPLTIIFHSSSKITKDLPHLKYVKLKSDKSIIKMSDVVKHLFKLGYNSLLIEGGAFVYSQFIKENLFDELNVIVAPKIIGDGLSPFKDFKIDRIAKAKELFLKEITLLDKDIVLKYKNY
ncbi:MAG: bifunctional diaminohydroxyphosphoribosylaminopyrimidine deaminase/5-amino-6-(5-phosphoribosylamino)uracil reductase RibD [Ignavibacteriota bacterium]|nr:bifunctional diaminohydroxyphosphoribosylaminopyrimidine deaminase/5-amino-6-(5-phosphoribosylamino)uracil reductase RibD [Ignavibacteriota bacterium]